MDGSQTLGVRDRPVGRVIEDIVVDVQDILRSEIQLAKAEIREEATKATKAGRAFATGGVLGLYAVGFLLLTIMWALGLVMSLWLAALIVGVVVGVIAAALIGAGRKRLKRVHPVPQRAVDSMKENAKWLRNQTR